MSRPVIVTNLPPTAAALYRREAVADVIDGTATFQIDEAIEDIVIKAVDPRPQPCWSPPPFPAGTDPITFAWPGPAPHPPQALPRLVPRGAFLAQADGTYWTAIGNSDFNLYARYLEGMAEPVIAQRAECEFNLARIFTAYNVPPKSVDDPGIGRLIPDEHSDYYDRLPAFLALLARYGIYAELTAYTGWNDPLHWPRLIEAVKDCTNVAFLDLINEEDQNANSTTPDPLGRTWHIEDYQRTAHPLLCGHGSNGSQQTPVRGPSGRDWWDVETFHTNDAPEWWRKVGHNAMELSTGAEDLIGSGVPVISDENTRFPDHDTSEAHAYDAAAGAALLCAGSVFHSVQGKNSTLWTGQALVCAKASAAGARSVPLWAQDGQYAHRIDLEGPNDLRVYERRLGDGRSHQARIRK